MRAVVVYESMYGNTHLVADAIGAGLSTALNVSVVPVSQAVLADASLVVVGGPTHVHGMSRAATRKAAVQDGAPAREPAAGDHQGTRVGRRAGRDHRRTLSAPRIPRASRFSGCSGRLLMRWDP